MTLAKEIKKLKSYFNQQSEVMLAFLFGSQALGKQTLDSDIDIAVYFKPLKPGVEWKEKRLYQEENEVWSTVKRILETDNLDLLVLNRANPVLANSVLENGIPLVIKDKSLYLDFYLMVSNEAEDFSGFMEDYLKIKISSRSLNPETKNRLMQRLDYLLTYWPEKEKFSKLDFDSYRGNPDQRRNIERWLENIANATIDIAKIILASEKKQMPKSYEEALLDLGFLFGLNEEEAKKFSSEVAKLRNILAHEYLDILYERIKNFFINISPFYKKLLDFLRHYLEITST